MPNYKGHLAGGMITYLIVLAVVTRVLHVAPSPLTAFEWCVATLLGALFPDIDVKSKGQFIFYAATGICLVYAILFRWWLAAVVCSVIVLVPLLVKHRGLLHRFWFVLVCAVVSIVICSAKKLSYCAPLQWDIFFFVCGAFSHITLDRIQTRLKVRLKVR